MAVKRSIGLACDVCKERNYITDKNSKKVVEKLELNKYCSRCKKATTHKEYKKK